MLAATIVLVAVTWRLTVFTGRLWKTTVDAVKDTAAGLALANKTYIATHRPKVIVRGFVMVAPDLEVGKPIGFAFSAQNIGDSPARVVEVRSATVILKAAERIPGDFRFPFSEAFDLELVSGQDELFPANGGSAPDATESFAVFSGDYALYCMGTITYLDDNGLRRHTGFCRRYRSREQEWETTENPEYEYAY